MAAIKRKTKAAKKRTARTAHKAKFAKTVPSRMKKNPGYGVAHAAAWDAANRHAKAHGRKAWNAADYAVAVKEFDRLYKEPSAKRPPPRKKVMHPAAPKKNPNRAEIRAAVEKVYGRKVSEAEVSKALKAAIAIHNIPKKRDIQITHYRGKQNPSKEKLAARGAKAAIRVFDTNKDGDVDKADVKRLKKGPKKNSSEPTVAQLIRTLIKDGWSQISFGEDKLPEVRAWVKRNGGNVTGVRGRRVLHIPVKLRSPKKNPGMLSALAEAATIVMGIEPAMQIANALGKQKTQKAKAPKKNASQSARTKRPAKKAAAKRPKKNPASGKMFEEFHGRPASNKPTAVYAPYGTPLHTDELGVLWYLIMADGQVFDFRREATGRTYYANGKNTAARPDGHIFIVGAPFGADKDPSIPLDEVRPIGTISSIVYLTKKDREGDKTPEPYKHPFKGPRPVLGIDRFGDAHFVGGGYKIRPEGIVD